MDDLISNWNIFVLYLVANCLSLNHYQCNQIACTKRKIVPDIFNCIWLIRAQLFDLCKELLRNAWNVLIKLCIFYYVGLEKRQPFSTPYITQWPVMQSYDGDLSHHDMVASKFYINNLSSQRETVKSWCQWKTYNVQ